MGHIPPRILGENLPEFHHTPVESFLGVSFGVPGLTEQLFYLTSFHDFKALDILIAPFFLNMASMALEIVSSLSQRQYLSCASAIHLYIAGLQLLFLFSAKEFVMWLSEL